MSHYSKISVECKRKSAIAKALLAMGFEEHMVEVSDTPMMLKMYDGSESKNKAEIRVKAAGWSGQNYVGGLVNDLGFEQQSDGTFTMHADGRPKNKSWQDQFLKEYSRAVVHEICEEQNFFIESEEEEDGEIVINIQSMF